MTFRADLHCHSTCSDGTLSVEELLLLAKASGIQGLSITDHDTIAAYPEALILGKKLGIQVIPGVEFSAHYKGKSVHILGYSFDYKSPFLHQLCERHRLRREERNRLILEKLKAKNMVIQPEELAESTALHTIGRPHIAKLLVEKGFAKDIAEAFHRYIGDGKPCYAQGNPFTIEETLEAIHKANGLAVLAHPHLQNSRSFIRDILTHPFDGLECEYAQMSPKQNAPWLTLASERKLLMTGGSDFHGSVKPTLKLGATVIDQEKFSPLLAHLHEL